MTNPTIRSARPTPPVAKPPYFRKCESRFFEVLLPALAAAFVFWSIPKQMKNYFGTGLLFLAMGIIRLEQNWLRDRAAWPVALMAGGVALMLCAANYAGVRMSIAGLFRRR